MRLTALMLCLLATACASQMAGPTRAPGGKTVQIEGIQKAVLNEGTVAGTCIWTYASREDVADIPILAIAPDDQTITMRLDGQDVRLERRREVESARSLVFESSDIKAKIMLRENGDTTRKAVLALTRADGWSTMIPLLGRKLCP